MNGRILIIDDEETLCYFLKESLEEKGYQAVAAHTAADGLEKLAVQGADLVLLDLKLPDGEGLDVLSEIRKVDAELPVIVLTGHAAVETAVRAMKLGAYDYLEKPVNLAQLTSSVGEVLKSTRRERRSGKTTAREVEVAEPPYEELRAADEVSAETTGELEQTSQTARRLRQMKRTLEEVTLVDALGCDLLRHDTVRELTESAAEGLLRLPSVDMIAIFVGDAEDEDMVLAAQRRFRADVWDEPGLRRLPVDGVLAQAVRRWDGGLPLSEAGPDPWVEEVNARLGEGTTAALVPLRDGRLVWGVMLLARESTRAYDRAEIDVFCSAGERLAMALKQANRLASLQERTSWLAEREAHERLLLESLPNGVVVVDGAASVTLVNRAAERLLGCREEDVLGNGLEGLLGAGALIVRDSLQRDLDYVQEQIVAGANLEARIPLQMSVSPLRDGSGAKNGAIITLSDLRRAKEQEEEKSKRERLSVLAEVSGVVAHEIRNPLAGMVAGIQHLLTKFRAGDERHEALQRILKEGERVDRIVEDILLLTRPPHLELAPCDISEVVARVVEEHDSKAKASGVQVRRFHTAGLPLVRADEKRLRQALSKLVLNGIEAMPSGGSLDIVITGPSKGEAERVEVEISDHGAGIREEDRGRLFEPFYTTKTRGTGLGLAIAKRIIDGHSGEIEVLSEEGEGTKVIVRLPLAGRGG
jgi:PAS domain S-box-containing protein